MSKYRKKPCVIEAVQFTGDNLTECGLLREPGESAAYIDTLEGRMTASPGDYVITGVKGERYPCKPDIFEATYDPAQEAADPASAASVALHALIGALRDGRQSRARSLAITKMEEAIHWLGADAIG